jgi:ABC-type amino acid transport substrate-binding protein
LNLVLPLSELEQDLYIALSHGTAEEVVDSIRNQFTALIENGRLDTLQRTFLESQSSDVMPD